MRELFLYLLGVCCSAVWQWKGHVHATDKTFFENKGGQLEKGDRNRKGAPNWKRAAKYSQILLALYKYVNMRLSSLTSNLYHYKLIIIINSNQSELGFAGTSWKVHQLPLRNFHSKEHKKLLVIHQCSDFVVSHLKLTLFKFTVNSGSAVTFCATKS